MPCPCLLYWPIWQCLGLVDNNLSLLCQGGKKTYPESYVFLKIQLFSYSLAIYHQSFGATTYFQQHHLKANGHSISEHPNI